MHRRVRGVHARYILHSSLLQISQPTPGLLEYLEAIADILAVTYTGLTKFLRKSSTVLLQALTRR